MQYLTKSGCGNSDILTTNSKFISICEYNVNIINYAQFTDTRSDMIVGTEGFLTNLFISIGDTIFHLINNFKTLFKAFRDFKRGELRYYLESHKIKTDLILKTDFNILKWIDIPIPKGMNVSYLEACNAIDGFLTSLSMPTRVDSIYQYLIAVKTDLNKSNQLNTNRAIIDSNISGTSLNKAFDNITRKIFNNKNTNEVPLGTVYSSNENMKEVIAKILDMENHLVGVANIYSRMEDISDVVDEIILYLEDKNNRVNISSNNISKLAGSIRDIAVIFEKYGITINDVSRLDHNQMEVMDKLIRTID